MKSSHERWRRLSRWALPLTLMVAFAAPIAAQDGIDTGDTAWIITASAMVLLMTPDLAFFYGGLVRRVCRQHIPDTL